MVRWAAIAEAFHANFFERGLYITSWRGVQVQKCPLDLWFYAQLIHQVAPLTIIETGSDQGGSALFFADCQAHVTCGQVFSVDSRAEERPAHVGVAFVAGDAATLEWLPEDVIAPVLVSLDSDHTKAHVLRELELYAPLVTPGSYLVVEDTNINGHPVLPGWGDGPAEAVAEWLAWHGEFEVVASPFGFSFNTWLRRR